MKWILLIGVSCLTCVRQPALPSISKHNVTAVLNDSAWFATGKAIRLFQQGDQPSSVQQFNLQIVTDLDFPGNNSASRSPAITGCNGDCVPTQRLHLYNIPLKKGKYKLVRLDKRRTVESDKTNYVLLIDGSGVYKNYQPGHRAPNWIRITNYNRSSNTIDGQFRLNLDANQPTSGTVRTADRTAATARFREGLFQVKLIDVTLK